METMIYFLSSYYFPLLVKFFLVYCLVYAVNSFLAGWYTCGSEEKELDDAIIYKLMKVSKVVKMPSKAYFLIPGLPFLYESSVLVKYFSSYERFLQFLKEEQGEEYV